MRLPGSGTDVWLRSPAPLDTDLREQYEDTHLSVWDGEAAFPAEADPCGTQRIPSPSWAQRRTRPK